MTTGSLDLGSLYNSLSKVPVVKNTVPFLVHHDIPGADIAMKYSTSL
jgi:hypothetical protein